MSDKITKKCRFSKFVYVNIKSLKIDISHDQREPTYRSHVTSDTTPIGIDKLNNQIIFTLLILYF